MLQQLRLPVYSITCKHENKPKTQGIYIANNKTNSTSKLKRKLDWCLVWFLWFKNEIQVLSQVSFKTPTLYEVTAEVAELNNIKNIKKTPFISSQNTIMKQDWPIEKKFKTYRFKHELKITFLFNCYAKQNRLKR